MYNLNAAQDKGLKEVLERYKLGEKYATIAGYAGTGKTYLVRAIIDAMGLSAWEYDVATFTGKAALVLQQNGFHNAMTLHKLLFNSVRLPDGAFIHRAKPVKDKSLANLKVIIIDEISMVPNAILAQAAKHGIFIIALGDPFQLPPIGEDNGLLKNPHVFLKDIMRQAEGNSIIEWSMKVREGRRFKWENDANVQIVELDDVVDGMYHWADQIICATNKTRKSINSFMRRDLGFTNVLPENGDKIIATRNNWDRVHTEGYAWVNGTIGTIQNVVYGEELPLRGQKFVADVVPDYLDIPFMGVEMDGNPFKGMEPMEVLGKKKIESVDFGYAITTHKSQGSQYPKILLFEEDWRSDQALQMLYTGGTRAQEKLVVVKKRRNSFFL